MTTAASKSSSVDWCNIDTGWQVIIPKEVDQRITRVCQRANNLEWSGLISFKREDHRFIIDDFTIADLGSAGYTSFLWDSSHSMFMSQKAAQGFYFGHIHMHPPGMSTSPSSIDDNMLIEGAEGFDYFMMLIVHVTGNNSCRIGWMNEEPVKEFAFEGETIPVVKPYTNKRFYCTELDVIREGLDSDEDRRMDNLFKDYYAQKKAMADAQTKANNQMQLFQQQPSGKTVYSVFREWVGDKYAHQKTAKAIISQITKNDWEQLLEPVSVWRLIDEVREAYPDSDEGMTILLSVLSKHDHERIDELISAIDEQLTAESEGAFDSIITDSDYE